MINTTINNTNTTLTLTDKQFTTYRKIYDAMWKLIDRSIQSNYKNKRSAGFKMARTEAFKIVVNNNVKTGTKLYDAMWRIVDKNVENKNVRSKGFALARELTAKFVG